MLSLTEEQPKDLAKNGASLSEELLQHLYKTKIKTLAINTLKIIFYF
jgi:hypothetical protein